MEINKNIHTAVTVASRFAELNSIASNAANLIVRLRANTFTDLIPESDKDILKKADEIARRVQSLTSVHDAEKYLKKLTEND